MAGFEFFNVNMSLPTEFYYEGDAPDQAALLQVLSESVDIEEGKLSITYKAERQTYVVSWTQRGITEAFPSRCVSFYGGELYKALLKAWIFLILYGGIREGFEVGEDNLRDRQNLIREKLKDIMK